MRTKKAAFERQLIDRLDEAETEIIHGPIPRAIRAAIYENAMAIFDRVNRAERAWRSCVAGVAFAWVGFVGSAFIDSDTKANIVRSFAFGGGLANAYYAGRWSTQRRSLDSMAVTGGVITSMARLATEEEDEA